MKFKNTLWLVFIVTILSLDFWMRQLPAPLPATAPVVVFFSAAGYAARGSHCQASTSDGLSGKWPGAGLPHGAVQAAGVPTRDPANLS
jgi:hypothetical protein